MTQPRHPLLPKLTPLYGDNYVTDFWAVEGTPTESITVSMAVAWKTTSDFVAGDFTVGTGMSSGVTVPSGPTGETEAFLGIWVDASRTQIRRLLHGTSSILSLVAMSELTIGAQAGILFTSSAALTIADYDGNTISSVVLSVPAVQSQLPGLATTTMDGLIAAADQVKLNRLEPHVIHAVANEASFGAFRLLNPPVTIVQASTAFTITGTNIVDSGGTALTSANTGDVFFYDTTNTRWVRILRYPTELNQFRFVTSLPNPITTQDRESLLFLTQDDGNNLPGLYYAASTRRFGQSRFANFTLTPGTVTQGLITYIGYYVTTGADDSLSTVNLGSLVPDFSNEGLVRVLYSDASGDREFTVASTFDLGRYIHVTVNGTRVPFEFFNQSSDETPRFLYLAEGDVPAGAAMTVGTDAEVIVEVDPTSTFRYVGTTIVHHWRQVAFDLILDTPQPTDGSGARDRAPSQRSVSDAFTEVKDLMDVGREPWAMRGVVTLRDGVHTESEPEVQAFSLIRRANAPATEERGIEVTLASTFALGAQGNAWTWLLQSTVENTASIEVNHTTRVVTFIYPVTNITFGALLPVINADSRFSAVYVDGAVDGDALPTDTVDDAANFTGAFAGGSGLTGPTVDLSGSESVQVPAPEANAEAVRKQDLDSQISFLQGQINDGAAVQHPESERASIRPTVLATNVGDALTFTYNVTGANLSAGSYRARANLFIAGSTFSRYTQQPATVQALIQGPEGYNRTISAPTTYNPVAMRREVILHWQDVIDLPDAPGNITITVTTPTAGAGVGHEESSHDYNVYLTEEQVSRGLFISSALPGASMLNPGRYALQTQRQSGTNAQTGVYQVDGQNDNVTFQLTVGQGTGADAGLRGFSRGEFGAITPDIPEIQRIIIDAASTLVIRFMADAAPASVRAIFTNPANDTGVITTHTQPTTGIWRFARTGSGAFFSNTDTPTINLIVGTPEYLTFHTWNPIWIPARNNPVTFFYGKDAPSASPNFVAGTGVQTSRFGPIRNRETGTLLEGRTVLRTLWSSTAQENYFGGNSLGVSVVTNVSDVNANRDLFTGETTPLADHYFSVPAGIWTFHFGVLLGGSVAVQSVRGIVTIRAVTAGTDDLLIPASVQRQDLGSHSIPGLAGVQAIDQGQAEFIEFTETTQVYILVRSQNAWAENAGANEFVEYANYCAFERLD